jgi:hypothetical protein
MKSPSIVRASLAAALLLSLNLRSFSELRMATKSDGVPADYVPVQGSREVDVEEASGLDSTVHGAQTIVLPSLSPKFGRTIPVPPDRGPRPFYPIRPIDPDLDPYLRFAIAAPDGQSLYMDAWSSADRIVQVDPVSQKVLQRLWLPDNRVRAMDLDPAGRFLYVMTINHVTSTYELLKVNTTTFQKSVLASWPYKGDSISETIQIDAAGAFAYITTSSSSGDSALEKIDLKNGGIQSVGLPGGIYGNPIMLSPGSDVGYLPVDSRLISVRLPDLSIAASRYFPDRTYISSTAFDPKGRFLVNAGYDNYAKKHYFQIIDVATLQITYIPLDPYFADGLPVVIDPKGRYIFFGTAVVRIADLAILPASHIIPDGERLTSTVFNPDGTSGYFVTNDATRITHIRPFPLP